MPELLYENKIGVITQLETICRISLQINESHYQISITEFLRIRSLLNQVDIIQAIQDVSDAFDNIEISLKNLKQVIATSKFTLCQVINLKDLFNGAHFAMELQDILSRRGIALSSHLFQLSYVA